MPKQQLEYFFTETNMLNDSKISALLYRHGAEGYGLYFMLLQMIYGTEGYYMPFGELQRLRFAHTASSPYNPVTEEKLDNYLSSMIKFELFDEDIYNDYQILTSRGIQKRYLEGCKRRKSITFIKEYVILNVDNYVESEMGSSFPDIDYVSIDDKDADIEDDDADIEDDDVNIEDDDIDSKPDYRIYVEAWNEINEAKVRLTNKKKKDIDRALKDYSRDELMSAMKIRAQSKMLKPAHRRDWNTFFGRKRLENVDKWVDRGQDYVSDHQDKNSLKYHLSQGWLTREDAKLEADGRGMEVDEVWFTVKVVEGTEIFKPNFDL